MSVIGSNIIAGASGTVETGYQISRSLRFNSADSAYLNRTPGTAGNRKTWTWSGWVKRSALGSVQGIFEGFSSSNNISSLHFTSGDAISFQDVSGASYNLIWTSAAVWRDVGAWYHITFVYDSTQASSANAAKLYVNGVQQTLNFTAATGSYSQNRDTWVNSVISHRHGLYNNASYINGYITEVNFIDGQALTPSDFGETSSSTGVWTPKAYTGSYGTNGFWLKFDDNSGVTATTLGKDSSGNGNNWTPNNFSVTAGVGNDSLVDSPTNYGTDTGAGGEVRGNYATLNPLNKATNSSLSNGNLAHTGSGAAWLRAYSTIWFSDTSNFYAEVTMTGLNAGSNGQRVGIANFNSATDYVGSDANSWGYDNAARKFNNAVGTSYGASFSQGDVIGIHFNNGTLTFYKNGVSQGSAYTGLTGTFCFAGSVYSTDAADWNFGQRAWAYAPPSGAKALCTQNLPTPAIGASASTLASKNFNVITYTGDGTSSRNITGVGFAPDFVWFKNRASASFGHRLYDIIRGATKELYSHSTAAEFTETTGLTAFGSDGYTVGSQGGVNENGSGLVTWNWKANGAGSSNTAGSITSTVSANTTAGISVVTWNGNTAASANVGHGLGVTPAFIISKIRGTTNNWWCYHRSLGTSASIALNLTNASAADTWAVSSSTFTYNFGVTGTYNCVAYCFAEVAGFSKFGSYTGNGSADGPFVYCGFRPRYVMIKRTDAINDWGIFDTARNTYNLTDLKLWANSANAENSTIWTVSENNIDILSNGFKVRVTNAGINASGGTYIFMAFGESPFNYSRAR